jgi:radical SAM protein with 4Fe4S-binding SPASM domain
MTAGAGRASGCDSCGVDVSLDELREQTKRAGFRHPAACTWVRAKSTAPTPTRWASRQLYKCPGFSGEATEVVGHISREATVMERESARRFNRLAAYELCGDCAFVPVCAGGCAVASHHELGDMHAPTCHRRAFESALVTLARDTASSATEPREGAA